MTEEPFTFSTSTIMGFKSALMATPEDREKYLKSIKEAQSKWQSEISRVRAKQQMIRAMWIWAGTISLLGLILALRG